MLAVCIREVQKTLAQSSKRLIEDKIRRCGVGSTISHLQGQDRDAGRRLIVFQGMQDHTAEWIKSLEGFKRAWIEEAQTFRTAPGLAAADDPGRGQRDLGELESARANRTRSTIFSRRRAGRARWW